MIGGWTCAIIFKLNKHFNKSFVLVYLPQRNVIELCKWTWLVYTNFVTNEVHKLRYKVANEVLRAYDIHVIKYIYIYKHVQSNSMM